MLPYFCEPPTAAQTTFISYHNTKSGTQISCAQRNNFSLISKVKEFFSSVYSVTEETYRHLLIDQFPGV